MSLSNYNLALERIVSGRVKDLETIKLRGHNAAISTSDETVWGPGATYARLSAAVAFEVISGDAADAAAGTGARTVDIRLVDGNYKESTVTATLNGTNAVAITGTYLACNGIKVATAGSGLTNAGVVSVRTVSGSVVKRQLTASPFGGLGKDADFIFTIPADHYGILKPVRFGISGATGAYTVYLYRHDSAGLIFSEGSLPCGLAGGNGAGDADLPVPHGLLDFGSGLLIPEKNLIELRVDAAAGAGDLVAMGELILVKSKENSFVL